MPAGCRSLADTRDRLRHRHIDEAGRSLKRGDPRRAVLVARSEHGAGGPPDVWLPRGGTPQPARRSGTGSSRRQPSFVAFDVLDPALRSRGGIPAEAGERAADDPFRATMTEPSPRRSVGSTASNRPRAERGDPPPRPVRRAPAGCRRMLGSENGGGGLAGAGGGAGGGMGVGWEGGLARVGLGRPVGTGAGSGGGGSPPPR